MSVGVCGGRGIIMSWHKYIDLSYVLALVIWMQVHKVQYIVMFFFHNSRLLQMLLQTSLQVTAVTWSPFVTFPASHELPTSKVTKPTQISFAYAVALTAPHSLPVLAWGTLAPPPWPPPTHVLYQASPSLFHLSGTPTLLTSFFPISNPCVWRLWWQLYCALWSHYLAMAVLVPIAIITWQLSNMFLTCLEFCTEMLISGIFST